MSKELQLGEIKISDLSDWFGIKKNSFSKAKQKKMEELKLFCDYELVSKTKISITNIYSPIYEKSASENYEKIKQEIPKIWKVNYPETCSRVSAEIVEQKNNKGITLTNSSIYNYTRKASVELYGKRGSRLSGELGISEYIWAKQNETKTGYEFLTDEELAVKTQLLQQYFGNAQEKSLFIQESIQRGELKEEEAWREYDRIMNLSKNFVDFLEDFYKITGVRLVKCTLVELMAYCAKPVSSS